MPTITRTFASADATETAFYDAMTQGDLDAMMRLWADEDEIVCIHPGAPRLIGHVAIRASWEAVFSRGGIDIRPVERHVLHATMTATHNVIEIIGHDSCEAQDRHVLATNIYLKTPAGWRIMLHHASIAPGAAPMETAPPSTLH